MSKEGGKCVPTPLFVSKTLLKPLELEAFRDTLRGLLLLKPIPSSFVALVRLSSNAACVTSVSSSSIEALLEPCQHPPTRGSIGGTKKLTPEFLGSPLTDIMGSVKLGQVQHFTTNETQSELLRRSCSILRLRILGVPVSNNK